MRSSRPFCHIGAKLAGVHWWWKTASHAAELTAGYYNTWHHDGYLDVMAVLARHHARASFTCIEMRDVEHSPEGRCSPQGACPVCALCRYAGCSICYLWWLCSHDTNLHRDARGGALARGALLPTGYAVSACNLMAHRLLLLLLDTSWRALASAASRWVISSTPRRTCCSPQGACSVFALAICLARRLARQLCLHITMCTPASPAARCKNLSTRNRAAIPHSASSVRSAAGPACLSTQAALLDSLAFSAPFRQNFTSCEQHWQWQSCLAVASPAV